MTNLQNALIATPDVGMRVVKTGEAYEVRNFVREIKSAERSEFIRYYDYLCHRSASLDEQPQ